MSFATLIDQYAAGAQALQDAVRGMTREQLRARPVPGKWSTHEVICHVADFEIVGADRIKRTISDERPTLADGDENAFAQRLAYDARDTAEELQLITAIRGQVTRILRTLKDEDYSRIGVHTSAGPLTLKQYVERGINHIPHHVKFIEEKRKALGA